MIRVKIKDWKEVYGLVHTSTIWELATDSEFKNIIYTKEDEVHKSYFEYDVDVPIDTVYYLRSRKQMNYGANEVTGETIEIKAEDTIRDNIILDRDLHVDTPSVYVTREDIDTEDTIRVSTSAFRADGDQHAYTHWILEDGTGKILWKSLYDTNNLTKLDMSNIGQPYVTKSKLVFKAIHGTKVGMESKTGNFTIFTKQVNFEIIGVLSQVRALKDLKISFKKIDPDFRLGITSIIIKDESTEALSKSYYDITEEGITLNWWLLRNGVTLIMEINAIDINDNIVKVNKRITVEQYGNELVKDPTYKYTKDISSFTSSDFANSPDFYIPNNYSCESLHNGLIPIPKLGRDKTKLYFYSLTSENKLQIQGEYPGIEILNDETKEGMMVRRVNSDLILISHTKTTEGGAPQHELMLYKHNTITDGYNLIKRLDVEGEMYGLGSTNAFIQTDVDTIYYIQTNSDRLKKIDLTMLSVTLVSANIPFVLPENPDELNNPNRVIITPIMIKLPDGRIFITGGYSTNGTTYDPYTNTFAESLYWEWESYIANRLSCTPLINGDAIIVKKEDEKRLPDQAKDYLYSDQDIVVQKSLEEIYDMVNKDPLTSETKFTTDLESYDVTTGSTFEIPITNNFESTDVRQFYVLYDKQYLRLDNKNTNKLRFHVLTNPPAGKREVRIIASKDQIFDQTTYLSTKPFTHKVIDKRIIINTSKPVEKPKEEMDNIIENESHVGFYSPLTDVSSKEYLWILGKRIDYASEEIVLNCYKEESKIVLPVEVVNVLFSSLEFDYEKDKIKGFLDFQIVEKTKNLFLIELSNILIDDPFRVIIRNTLNNAEFVSILFNFIDTPIKGLPAKPRLNRNGTYYVNGDTMSFFDLIGYNIDVGDETEDPVFTPNRTNSIGFSIGAGLNKYKMSIRAKGLIPLFVSYKNFPKDVYCNNFIYINSVDAVPKLDVAVPNISLKAGKELIGTLQNDFSGFKNQTKADGLDIVITQDLLSKSLSTITYADSKIVIMPTDKVGSATFSITAKNKADGALKQSTFNYTIYPVESYPVGLVWTFPDSTTGDSGETIYLNPGTENKFEYTVNGNKVELDLPRGSIFNVEKTLETIPGGNKLIIYPNRDLGKDEGSFKFYNKAGTLISTVTKKFLVVPVIFYTRDPLLGDVRIDNYPFTMQNGTEETFRIVPKSKDGYRLTSINIKSKKTYQDIKFYLNSVTEDNKVLYDFIISTPDSEEAKEYDFIIEYGYVNNNANDILTITEEYQQSFKVTSLYYKQQSYINLESNNITIAQDESRVLKIDTNAKYTKMTLGNTGIVSIDNETNTITGLKPGRATIIIEAGSPQQIKSQDQLIVNVTEPEPEIELPQGFFNLAPENIRLFPGTSVGIDWSTNAESLNISTENRTIATYDSVKKLVVAKDVGETRLKVDFRGSKIKGGTKFYNIKVLPLPDGDPDIVYYDSFNHEIVKTDVLFSSLYPTSVLVDRSGRVVLSAYKNTSTDKNKPDFRTYYCVFY